MTPSTVSTSSAQSAPRTLRDQLLANGFKESPVVLVDRLYKQLLDWSARPVWNARFRSVVASKVQELTDKINKICEERQVGNPLKGEVVDWKK